MTPAGIEPATFQFVAQIEKKIHHDITACPLQKDADTEKREVAAASCSTSQTFKSELNTLEI